LNKPAQHKMAAVYKSIAKPKQNGTAKDVDGEAKPRNRQRVLILSSRGVTYRYALQYTPPLYTYH
jgi:hypothetical protein